MDTLIKCTICNKIFSQRKNLYLHTRKFHDTELLPVKKYECQVCNNHFLSTATLNTHIKTFHTDDNNLINKTRIICPYGTCNEEFFTFIRQRKHLCDIHEVEC